MARSSCGTLLATEAERGFERAVGRIVEAANFVLAQAAWTNADLCGVGVGCTGPVIAERGIINNPYTLPTWSECDIVSPLRTVFGRPVYLENDADAAALGECFAGAGQDSSRVVLLTLGTGVGGGVVINSRVYRGTQGEHPELGHMPIDPDGPSCYCGTRGCLESIASGTSIGAAGGAGNVRQSRCLCPLSQGEPAAAAIVQRRLGAGHRRLDDPAYVHARTDRAGRRSDRRAL